MGEKTKKKGSISYAKWGYIFIAPFFIIFAVFQLIPLISTIYYSFFEYYRSGLKVIGPNFAGLKNYITLFSTDLPKYFSNTLILWIIGFIPQIAISLLLAAWFTDLRLIKDPEICDPIRFLREREIVHYQRFGESLRIVQEHLDSKNFYAFNPDFDCQQRNK